VRDLQCQNTCLLLKFIHKLLRGDDTPWARWVRRWYGANGIAEPPSPLDTPSWRSFKRVFAIYRGLTNVRVGDGATTSFWFDNWHAAGPLFARVPELLTHCTDPSITVAAALVRSPLDIPLHPRVTAIAQSQLAALATSLRLASLSDEPDTRLLPGGAAFSTAGAYRVMKTSGIVLPLADYNWANFAPLKVKVFFWIARHGNTRTLVMLHRHGILSTACCPFCSSDEDLLHLFFRCPRLGPWFAGLGAQAAASAADLAEGCASLAAAHSNLVPPVRHTLVLLTLWIIWKSRNRMVFDAQRLHPRQMFSLLATHCDLWLDRLPRRHTRQPVDAWLSALRAYFV
jgi:hypothetical protein